MKKSLETLKSSRLRKIFSEVDSEELVDLVEDPEVSDEAFEDASEELSSDDVEEALAAIAGIADAVLEVQGEEPKDLSYEEVLDIVDEVTQPELEEPTDEEIAIDEEIASSVVNLTVTADGELSEEIEIQDAATDEEIDTVIGVDNLDDCICPAPVEAEPTTDLAVASSRNVDVAKAKTFKVAINSHWKDIDAVHKKAWDMAEEKVKASGKSPDMGSRYYAQVMAIAKALYNRLTKGEVWEDAAELGSSKLRTVLSALRKIFSEEAKEYYFGEVKDGGTMVYTRDEYVKKFGEEPDESSKLEGTFSSKKAALKYLKSSGEFDGKTPPNPEAAPGTDGEASGIEDEGLLADGDQIHTEEVDGSSKAHQETDPLGEPADFGSTDTEEFILPNETGERESMDFVVASKNILFLKSSEAPAKYAHLHGKVRPLTNGQGVLFLKSNVFGLVAVKGTFQRGIKNCKYSAFVKTPEGYVDNAGNIFNSKANTKFLLASAVSNHSTSKTAPAPDILEVLESSYISWLKNEKAKETSYYQSVANKRKLFQRKLIQALTAQEDQVKQLQSSIKSSNAKMDDYMQKIAEDRYAEQLRIRDTAIQSEKIDSSQVNRNIDYLAGLM